jgi:hypothetical protein
MGFPIPGNNYFIVPQCAQDMALGYADDVGMSLILRPMSDRSFSQQWNAIAYSGDAGASGMNFQFMSQGFLLARANVWNSAAVLENGSFPHPEFANWNLLPNGDFFAIQSNATPDQNLNASGDGPYPSGTSVLCWDWAGGAPNELWKFVQF